MKVVEYKLLWGATVQQLVDRVNEYIQTGWIPSGGVAVAPEAFYQAIVLVDEERINIEGKIDEPKLHNL